MSLQFQPATAQDAFIISQLVNSAYRGDSSRVGWTTEADLLGGQRTDPDKIAGMIESPDVVLLKMLEEGHLLGVVELKRQADRVGYLGMFTVTPTRQGGGLGRQFLAAAEEFMRENWGVTKVEMTVISLRAELIAWYERRGYVNTGKRAAFPYEDVRFGEPKRPDLEFVILEKRL